MRIQKMKMDKPASYCEAIDRMKGEVALLNRHYHDHQYGFPIHSDDELFGRLILEINQAGLSWTTILKKQVDFRNAFDDFSIDKIACYGEEDVIRLLNNPSIIRNKLKIAAVIYNAQKVIELRNDYGSFKLWLDHHHPLSKQEWTVLFKKTFKFTGGEIVNEFLMSSGYLPGAHTNSCPIFAQVLKACPAWAHSKH